MMDVKLTGDQIVGNQKVDLKMNGKKYLLSIVYKPLSEPQVHIARILINVKEKKIMTDKKRKDGEKAIGIATIVMGIFALILWLLGYGRD
tara:strand:+ start:282 stop:551 length:270 start_codon:yes stop_codon:yes gene_type:complete